MNAADKPDQMKLYVRWMIRRDMPEVLAIETSVFQFPWNEDHFVRCLRPRNCIAMVADEDGRIVGYMLYELHKTRLHVLNLAVHPDHWRRGIGRAMVERLKGKLSYQRRARLVLDVRETNLAAQKFFRAMGFRAVNLLKGYYDVVSEDAILFAYRVTAPTSASSPASQGVSRWRHSK